MNFEPTAYGPDVTDILRLDSDGQRLLPLVAQRCSSFEANEVLRRSSGLQLFPEAFAPDAALSGLWLYFSCFDEAHEVAQDLPSAEGSYWHAILHRQEPDAANAGYWFRRVGKHAAYPHLLAAATRILADAKRPDLLPVKPEWDPFAFVEFCEKARRRPGSPEEMLARRITTAEWQLLFHYCVFGSFPEPSSGL